MFKKPLADAKTVAPLRSSDRRKLKQRVIADFGLQPEEGELLVPEGLQSQKISTHLNEPGVVYLSPEGDPLWFTLGKGSDGALIPTVYALWKKPDLLPFLSTPAPVVPKLIGGADLMIPGVVQHSLPLAIDQLVSVTQYHRERLGPPLAVGRMAVTSDTLRQADEQDTKGKAVYVLHTWKDCLWDMGVSSKMDVPEPREIPKPEAEVQPADEDGARDIGTNGDGLATEASRLHLDDTRQPADGQQDPAAEPLSDSTAPSAAVLSSEDVSSCLRSALLQALQTALSSLPPSAFPITASTFWSSYVLPARPVQPMGAGVPIDLTRMDVKHSTHKTVKVFLKACAKEGLIKLKEMKGDVVVTAVYPAHPSVAGHRQHKTVQSVEDKKGKAEARERQAQEAEEKRRGELHVAELWKPHGPTVGWFVAAEKDTSNLYSITDIKEIFNAYVAAKGLVNAQVQQYINVGQDEMLAQAVYVKDAEPAEFMKREDTLRRIRENMQVWHEIRTEGGETVRKKGAVKPVHVAVKIRQGRKACTLITGFETYGLNADELAQELRKLCASSTAVEPLPGKTADMEVMVQGKQIKAVTDLLVAKGVPARWIKAEDLSGSKKK
ncbi:eukaryotic translation initiation factor SUI1 family protein [Phanerochaete sordida]|uniref:Eukaryotic translation initiation factor SUI1 family protein n=1 Tax=Phanerochaete sordida TaxID=48140 RepID=A0A9P3G638_9APHY|nr:eukaryotic translation initiation factor SUI1 family protein [Phanerochaete sordida]